MRPIRSLLGWVQRQRDDFEDLAFRVDDLLSPDDGVQYVGRVDGNPTWNIQAEPGPPTSTVEVPVHEERCFVDHSLDEPGAVPRHWVSRS